MLIVYTISAFVKTPACQKSSNEDARIMRMTIRLDDELVPKRHVIVLTAYHIITVPEIERDNVHV